MSLRVLVIEPFYGGSHRQFLDQWREHSRHAFTLISFPGRHWKWRMRHAALSAAREIEKQAAAGSGWDILVASSMLALAELKGLSPVAARLPSVLYFHENQLTYPLRDDRRAGSTVSERPATARDAHFAYSNFLSCCAAEAIWFNSRFHLEQWFAELPGFLRRFPDYHEVDCLEALQAKAEVQWPGVEGPRDEKSDPTGAAAERPRPFEITWAARWEHDKNPEDFFEALRLLSSTHGDRAWRVNVLGETFRQVPACFERARRDLGGRICDWGFLPREGYLDALDRSHVFVATAHHEFFGLSVVEAMLAGARPLLPDRLSYPELVELDRDYLYDGTAEDLARRLGRLVVAHEGVEPAVVPLPEGTGWRPYAERFEWSRRVVCLDAGLDRFCARGVMVVSVRR